MKYYYHLRNRPRRDAKTDMFFYVVKFVLSPPTVRDLVEDWPLSM